MSDRVPDRGLVTPVFRSRTLLQVALLAVLCGVYAALPVWKENSRFTDVGDVPSDIHAALTLVLGWLLVFRATTAHARWWEARTLWGSLVNATRNLITKTVCLVQLPADEIAATAIDLRAFPFALRDHLRDESDLKALPGFADSRATPDHVPVYLAKSRYAALGRWYQQHWIDGDQLRVIDQELRTLLDVCGACERIRRTRIIRSYRLFARQCVLVFLLTLPWGIVNDFGWWTIPLTVIAAYFMLGMEIVAEHVEEPFGRDEDDLDLDSICQTISSSIDEITKPSASDAASRTGARAATE